MSKIIFEIGCLNCGEIITSKYRHNFVVCSCESIFIDGGADYHRYGYFKDSSNVDILTIIGTEGKIEHDKKRSKRKIK